MIITISGTPGAGKTTAAKLLAKKLKFKFYSMGDVRGKFATDRGMTIDQLNELGMKEAWTDKKVDEYQAKLAKKEDNFVLESRLGWFFIPKSIKIYMDVDEEVGAKRIFKAPTKQRKDEPKYKSVKELQKAIKNRVKHDLARYRKYYGKSSDFTNKSNFDLLIDTTNNTQQQTVNQIISFLKKKRLL